MLVYAPTIMYGVRLFILGAHARGLRCVCHYAQRSVQLKVPTASAQSGKHFKYGVFSKNASFKSYGVIYIPASVRPFHGVPSRRRRLQLLKSLAIPRTRSNVTSLAFLPQLCYSGYPSLFSVYFHMACNRYTHAHYA